MASRSEKSQTGVEEKNLVPHDEHVLAALLKTFYREMPELLIPDTLFDDLTTAAQDGIIFLRLFVRGQRVLTLCTQALKVR